MKINKFASLVGVVAIVAAACSSSTATTAPTTAASTAPSQAASEAAPSTGASMAASEAPSAAGSMSGTLTLWHSYGSGGGEGQAFLQALDKLKKANPGLVINVVEQPFSDIFNKWQTDVLAGGTSADMYIAPNDNLFAQSDAGALMDLTSQLQGKLDGFSQVAVDGSKVGDKFYMVPESLKAVALWYDKSAITTVPANLTDLMSAVKAGTVKLGLNQNAYHSFGFTGAYGGTLMDASGKCVADQTTGFSDAYKYFADLKAAGAKWYTDGNALKQDFQTGKLNAVVDGPWQTADFTKALGDKLAVVPIPAGTAKANPLTGTDGWYINPNSKNADLAIQVALTLVSAPYEQIMTDGAGHVPAAPGVTVSSPIVQGFATAAADGLPRPQTAQFGNYWGPFGDAINQVLDKGADPVGAVKNACNLMNQANKISG